MLVFVEAISIAGDRAKQNDDACGWASPRAWVIDGATDLHDAPLASAPSDAAWLAQRANAFFHAQEGDPRVLFGAASADARDWFDAPDGLERWKLPTASVLMVVESAAGIEGLDLGDSRCFALGADGAAFAAGGKPNAADIEAKAAADAAKTTAGPLLDDAATLARLRDARAGHNLPGRYAVFGLQPDCAAAARGWAMTLQRPAHVLLATDGFSALVDRYAAYDAAGLVRAARDKGLQELARELRAIEAADAGGARHPRFKPSDDATALLLRLT